MASVNWKKLISSNDVKAVIRHSDKETRKVTEHSNEKINKDLTNLNMQTRGSEYDEACAHLDERHEYLLTKPKATKRKDKVHAIGLTIPRPKDLKSADVDAWFGKMLVTVRETLCIEKEDEIASYIHKDEIHEYVDANTGEDEMSREHAHYIFVPTYRDKDGNERLSANKIMKRENMIKINNALDEMSVREFGVRFLDGTKRKGAEQDHLKRKSAILEAQRLEEITEQVKTLEDTKRRLEAQISANKAILEKQHEAIERKEDETLKSVNAEGRYQVEDLIEKSDDFVFEEVSR